MSTHGKHSKLWIETTPGGGTKPPTATPTGYTAVSSAYSFRMALAKDLAEADVFGDEEHHSEAGLKGGSLTFDLRYLQSIISVLLTAYNSDTPFSAISRPEGDSAGKYQLFADYHIESLEISGSTGDLVNGSVSLRRNGAVTYAAIGA